MSKNKQAESYRLLARRGYELFRSFRDAYAGEWERLDRCERLYRGEHWLDVPQKDPNEPRPMNPILHSTVENIAADMADRVPVAVITPESAADGDVARIVEAVVARNHDAASYEVEYQKLIHDLLVSGYCVHETGYDPCLNGGLGGAFIRHTDNRCIMFDPLCRDIQDGRAVFKFSLRPREWVEAHFPEHAQLIDQTDGACSYVPEDTTVAGDRRGALLLIEFWYREFDAALNSYSVHMALLCGGVVLNDSKDAKPNGYFAHGLYPFEVTTLYERKGSALGRGICDLFEQQQRLADKLDQIVLKNAFMASHNKLLVTEASGFDADDLSDWSREVHRGESLNGLTWFATPPLPAYIMSYIAAMRESVKDEGGANEASRGAVPGNVTAAGAIQALQEASSKRTRMATQKLHESFRRAVRMEIEVEREFSLYLRPVSVTVDGSARELNFDGSQLMKLLPDGGLYPIEFYISVKAARKTRFAAASQNELVMQLLSAGVLDGEQAVELMVFDGKEQVLKHMKDNRTGGNNEGQNTGGGADPKAGTGSGAPNRA